MKKDKLTKDDTAFLLWCLGYVYSLSDKLDEKRRIFIEKNHDIVLPKIAKIHESSEK